MKNVALILLFLTLSHLGRTQTTKVPFTGEILKGQVKQVTEILCDTKQRKNGDVKIDSISKHVTFYDEYGNLAQILSYYYEYRSGGKTWVLYHQYRYITRLNEKGNKLLDAFKDDTKISVGIFNKYGFIDSVTYYSKKNIITDYGFIHTILMGARPTM